MDITLGVIFSYRLKGHPPQERTQFSRGFIGYTDKSQFGSYTYLREGLMTRIPHLHVSNSLFIVSEEDIRKVKRFCKEQGVKLFIRKVVLTSSDLKGLAKQQQRQERSK